MKILVINSGSSSLKYQLIDMDNEQVMCKGLCERIGIEGSVVTHKAHDKEWEVTAPLPTHAEAFNKMLELMTKGEGAVVADKSEITAIGHRTVHGGEAFSGSVRITDEVIHTMEELSALAPLHNPPQVLGIRSAIEVFGPDVPQVGVFDTAFHQTMPEHAYLYALPYEYYEKHKIRRYGFHGTSHRYVSEQAAEMMGKPIEQLKIVTCHLGNGSSITAVDGGKSVDTSMGFTPMPGVVMGTRCGDIDPSIIPYLVNTVGMSIDEVDNMLNKESGLLGISGLSSDNRDVLQAAEKGNKRADLASSMLCYGIKKYIGAYAAAMGGLDCIVFTGGIGENSITTRQDVTAGMQFMGIAIDAEKNITRGKKVDISSANATVRTLVIPTDEELMIARDTESIITS